jgi:hypothetical protein
MIQYYTENMEKILKDHRRIKHAKHFSMNKITSILHVGKVSKSFKIFPKISFSETANETVFETEFLDEAGIKVTNSSESS